MARTRTAPWDYERKNLGLARPEKKCPVCGSPAFIWCLPDDRKIVDCFGECGEMTMTDAQIAQYTEWREAVKEREADYADLLDTQRAAQF